MANLIDSFLNHAAIESGCLVLKKTGVNVGELLRETIATFQLMAKPRGIVVLQRQ